MRACGHSAYALSEDGGEVTRGIRADLPDGVVIDLSRLPSQGREVGCWLRSTKAVCGVPFLFVAGAEAKVARVKQDLPDAIYTSWPDICSALHQLAEQPKTRQPAKRTGIVSKRTLSQKLGINSGCRLALLNEPTNIPQELRLLPEGVVARRDLRGRPQLILWFVTERSHLLKEIQRIRQAAEAGAGIWICWPKKSSELYVDLTGNDVRREGIEAGLVDFKVCAIDDDWSNRRVGAFAARWGLQRERLQAMLWRMSEAGR